MRSKLFSFHLVPIALLLAISILSHRIWFNPFAILTNGDVWFLYNEAMQTANWGTWASLLSLGGVNVSYNLYLLTLFWQLSAKLGLNYQIANQILYFFPTIFITPLAGYAYLYFLTKSRMAAFCGALFYLFPSFFLMSQNGGLLYTFVHAVYPLIFLLFERYIRFVKTKDGILFILLLSFAILYELRITYIVLLMLLGYTIFLFMLQHKKKFIFPLLSFIWKSKILLILFLAINAYIYVPTILTPVREIATAVTSRSLFGSTFFTIKEPLVLMHPFWTGYVPTEFIPQPIPFYFWLFPFYAFLSFYFIRHNKKIIFFTLSAILLVFLGKSSAEPWGDMYIWLYNNFPGFSFYREPSKFWPVLAFTYSVLIAYSTLYVPQELSKKIRWSAIASVSKFIFYAGIILVSLWVGKPAFTQELGPLFTHLHITPEHFAVKDFIASQKGFFRTYYVPGIYRMGYGSEIHPMLGLYDSPSYFQTFDPNILSLLSVKYVLFPPDITNDVYRGWGRRKDYEKKENLTGLKKIEDPSFGKFSVYENTASYKPHIYTISNLQYVQGEKLALPKILSLSDNPTSSVFLDDPTFIGGNEEINKIFYNGSSDVFTTASCIRCENRDYRSGFYFPFARFFPDSPFYWYIKDKEEKTLVTYEADVKEHARNTLFYALKRLIEVQRISDLQLHQEFAKIAILDQRRLNNIAAKDIEKILQEQESNQTLLFALYDNLVIQSAIINNIFAEENIFPDNKGMLQDNQDNIFKQIKKISERLWVSDDHAIRYDIRIPVKGTYTPYLAYTSTESATIQFGEQEKIQFYPFKEGWMNGQSVELAQGSYKVAVGAQRKNYATKTSIFWNNKEGKDVKEIHIPVSQLDGSSEYKLSFQYKISNYTHARYVLKREFDFVQAGYTRYGPNDFLTADNNWHSVSSGFTTRFHEKNAQLKFFIQAQPQNADTIEITNVVVQKTSGPLLVLKKQQNEVPKQLEQPKITFQWINPTKYRVYIENAKKPFYLVLSETFDKSWQASYSSDAKSSSPIVASYDNGKIQEQEGANNLDLLSFFSLFKKSEVIPVHTHINGYANAWYVEKPGTYTIIIEFAPQKVLMFSLFISSIAFLVAIGIYFFVLFKNEKKEI